MILFSLKSYAVLVIFLLHPMYYYIHHIVKTAEFDMGVEESYEYGFVNS